MQLSDKFIFLNKAKRKKDNPAKLSISACKTSKALAKNFLFPVAYQAIILGKVFLIKLTY